jgi:hypothetical protein
MKDGLSELDLRKPISVEKGQSQAPHVIQHKESEQETPELLTKMDVKIIRQTKNEVIPEVAAKLQETIKECIDDDDEFDRASIDDLNVECPFQKREKEETVDEEGNKWTTVFPYEGSWWQPHTKFERWIVNDGVRAELEIVA